MSGWQLEPAGVRSVLVDVEAQAVALQEALVGTEQVPVDHEANLLSGLGGDNPVLSPVAAAVVGALAAQAGNVRSVADRLDAAVAGVGGALAAYEQGNEEMAAQWQAAGVAAAAAGDFSGFDRMVMWGVAPG